MPDFTRKPARILDIPRRPRTAREGVDIILPYALADEPDALLAGIDCGGDIRIDGTSHCWRVDFFAPRQRRRICFSLEDAVNGPQVYLIETHYPFPNPDSGPARDRARGTLDESDLDRLWTEHIQFHGTLPSRFRDSPEVIREFTAQGLDLDHEPDVHLVASANRGGPPIWSSTTRDRIFTARFAADEP